MPSLERPYKPNHKAGLEVEAFPHRCAVQIRVEQAAVDGVGQNVNTFGLDSCFQHVALKRFRNSDDEISLSPDRAFHTSSDGRTGQPRTVMLLFVSEWRVH